MENILIIVILLYQLDKLAPETWGFFVSKIIFKKVLTLAIEPPIL